MSERGRMGWFVFALLIAWIAIDVVEVYHHKTVAASQQR